MFRSRNPTLNEHLLDDSEIELAPTGTGTSLSCLSQEETDELEDTIRKWRLEYPAETPEEKAIRINTEDRIDRAAVGCFGIVVGVSGEYVVHLHAPTYTQRWFGVLTRLLFYSR